MSNLYGFHFRHGQRHADEYEEDKLFEMLQSNDFDEIYEAMGAISQRKIRKALEPLKQMALNDDLGLQEEAIRTIRRIGGKKALDILHILKTTEHRDLIEVILKYGANVDQYDIDKYKEEKEYEKQRERDFRGD